MSIWINLEVYLLLISLNHFVAALVFFHCWYFSFCSSYESINSITFFLIFPSSLFDFKIEVKINLIENDFLDATFSLIERTFQPYKKQRFFKPTTKYNKTFAKSINDLLCGVIRIIAGPVTTYNIVICNF